MNRGGWAGCPQPQRTGAGWQWDPTMNTDTAGSKVVGRLILDIIKRVCLRPDAGLGEIHFPAQSDFHSRCYYSIPRSFPVPRAARKFKKRYSSHRARAPLDAHRFPCPAPPNRSAPPRCSGVWALSEQAVSSGALLTFQVRKDGQPEVCRTIWDQGHALNSFTDFDCAEFGERRSELLTRILRIGV